MDMNFKLGDLVITSDTYEVGKVADYEMINEILTYTIEIEKDHEILRYKYFDLLRPEYPNNIDIESLYLKYQYYYHKKYDYLTGFYYIYQAYYLLINRDNVEDMLKIKVLKSAHAGSSNISRNIDYFGNYKKMLNEAFVNEAKINKSEEFIKMYNNEKEDYDYHLYYKNQQGIDIMNCELIKGLDKYPDFYSFHDAKIIYYEMVDNNLTIKFKNYDIILTLKFINVVGLFISAPLMDSYVFEDAYCYKDYYNKYIEFRTNDYLIQCDRIELVE